MSDGPVLRFVSPAMLTVSPRQITLNFGNRGPKGDPGDPGPPGPATIDVGTTTTGLPGTNASVVNSGTSLNVILDFTIPRGDKGDQGDPGTPGTPGTPGADGKSVLNGVGAPGAGIGANGDFYIDTASETIYGPKTGGVWPTPGTSLVGPAGSPGTPGTDGLSVLNGTVDPTSGDGVDGEFWINTTTNYIFGPKAGGVWPSPGTSLVGPQGPPGPGQDVSAATHEPLGHADRAESTISFSNTTRIFTIAPTATTYEVWCAGTKYDLTTQSVTIPNTTGLYYLYFDASGVLHYKTTYFDWPNETPTAYVYWNSATAKAEFFADERHGIVLDWATHEYLHRTRGAAFATGFSLGSYTTTGTGNLNSDAQVGMGNGTFFDEDLQVDVVATATPTPNTWEQNLVSPGQIPMLRLDGTAWRRDTATTYPLKQGSVRPQYNLLSGSTWSSVDADNGKYVISWVMATNNLNEPVMAILGQDQYSSLNTARNATWDSLVLTGFPVFEFRPLYKLIFLTQTTMTNTPKAALADVQDLRGGSAVGGGTVVSDHGLLAGLADDDHTQYALADGSRGSFDALGAAAGVQANLTTHEGLTTTAHGGIVPSSRTVTAGTGLTGGGALSSNVTLTVSYGTTAGTAAAGNDSRITGAVQSTRSIIAGTGLSGGGDLTADRTLAVVYGTTAGTSVQGNDSRLSDGRVPQWRRLTFSDANYDLGSAPSPAVFGSVMLQQTGTVTTTRTVTLPAASAVPAGSELIINGGAGVTTTNMVTIQRAGSDTINGAAASVSIGTAWGQRRFVSDGVSAWAYDDGLMRRSANLSDVQSTTTALSNIGGVPTSRTITAGTGLTGGGDLSANRTLAVSLATSDIPNLDASKITTGYFDSVRTGYQIGVPSSKISAQIAGAPLQWGAPTLGGQPYSIGGMTLTQSIRSGFTVYLGVYVTASALTAGQGVYVVNYLMDPTSGLPTTLNWSQFVTVGTATGTVAAATGLSLTVAPGSYVGILNPSTNAGTVTLSSTTPITGPLVNPSLPNRTALSLASQGSTPPADISSYTWSNTTSGSTIGTTSQYGPFIYARVS